MNIFKLNILLICKTGNSSSKLIKEEMKHEQLIQALQQLGFNSDLHGLDISGVVAELMGIPEGNMSWEWFDVYMSFLEQAGHYEITGDGMNLIPLAETCYLFLMNCKKAEQTTNKKKVLERILNASEAKSEYYSKLVDFGGNYLTLRYFKYHYYETTNKIAF